MRLGGIEDRLEEDGTEDEEGKVKEEEKNRKVKKEGEYNIYNNIIYNNNKNNIHLTSIRYTQTDTRARNIKPTTYL